MSALLRYLRAQTHAQPPYEAARRTLARLQIVLPPIDVYGIVSRLGVGLDVYSGETAGASVSILRRHPPTIVLGPGRDARDPNSRVLVAHALGHILMHNESFRCRIDTGVPASFEHAATHFACHLLVPLSMFEPVVLSVGDEEVIANMFAVPRSVTRHQMNFLAKRFG